MVMRRSPIIRVAQAEDATRLAVLAAQVWLHTYATDGISHDIAAYVSSELTPEKYSALFRDASAHVLAAEHGDNLVGFAVVKFGIACPTGGRSSSELQTLYVQEHFTGQSIGKRLLQAAEAKVRERVNTPLWLTVNAQNIKAINFYAHLGYSKVGTTYFVLGAECHENHVLIGRDA